MAERRTRSAEEASVAPFSHHASRGRISQRSSSHKSGPFVIPKRSEDLTNVLLGVASSFPPHFCNPERTRGTLRIPAAASLGLARVMKQVLLRVTTMRAKIGRRELSQRLRRHSGLCAEILFAQYPLDPDVDRKRIDPLIGKQHHAIRDLRPHSGEIAQPFPQIRDGKLIPRLEIF